MMPQHAELDSAVRRSRVVFIIRRHLPCDLPALVAATIAGGARVIEITLNTPGALEAIRASTRRAPSGVFIGAGTVCTGPEVDEVAAHGGQFVVSPVFAPEVVSAAGSLGLASFPGVATPTEAWQAAKAGASYLKWFPAGSPDTFRILRGPFPHLPFVAVGGVTAANARDYLQAGCAAVGIGGALFSDPDLPLPALSAQVRATLAACAL